MKKLSWKNFILQVADDKASALVFGTRPRIEGPAQTADIKYGKSLYDLHTALEKAMPDAIARAKSRKNAQYIRHLESQGYTVLSPSETKELETFPGNLCDFDLAIAAMRKADAAIE